MQRLGEEMTVDKESCSQGSSGSPGVPGKETRSLIHKSMKERRKFFKGDDLWAES